MKLTKLPPAPWLDGGAVGCPRRTISDAGTASQLIAGVRRTIRRVETCDDDGLRTSERKRDALGREVVVPTQRRRYDGQFRSCLSYASPPSPS